MLKATGIGASLLVLLALAITFLKSLIAFIGFLTGAIKIIIVVAFVLLFVAIGFMVFQGIKNSRKNSD